MQLTRGQIEFFNGLQLYSESPNDCQSLFNLMPFCICWKNLDGAYVGRNRYAAEQMVFIGKEKKFNLDFVKNKTDYDLFDCDTAELFREHDIEVLNQPSQSQHFVERVALTTGEVIELISVKRCILDNDLKPIGTLSCTVSIAQYVAPNQSLNDLVKVNTLMKLRKMIIEFMASKGGSEYNEISDLLLSMIPLYPPSHEIRKLLILTPRELQCLCLLLKNLSSKHIAAILNLSFRTVEIHLANVKEKFYLPYKLEVIEWFWHLLSQL